MYNNISNDAKTALKSRVVTTTARITLTSNNQVIDGNNLVNVTITDQCYENGVIVGTAMAKEVEIELIDNNYDLADKEFSLEVGVLLPNNSYEYIPYGNFIVKDYQKIISSNHYKLIAYDYMDKFNATFVDDNPTLEDGVTYTTPMTLQSFYQYVANQYNVTIETQSNLPNANFSITTKPYLEGLSGRNVLSRIAEMMGCFAKINRNNKLEMKLKNVTAEQFSRNEMNNSLERDNRFGPINVISLRLSQVEGENVTKRDEASISQYGETTLQIQDNPFCYTEALRLAAINAIYNKVDGFSYYPTTFNGKLIYLDVGDEVEVQDMETDTYYKTIILKQVLKIPSTRNSKFENKALTNVGLEHQFTPEQVRKDRRTEYLVDKQNGVIQQIVETTEEIEREFETLQDIDGFAEGKYIYLDDASDELITSAKFNGETSQATRESSRNIFNKNAEINKSMNAASKTTLNTGVRVIADSGRAYNASVYVVMKLGNTTDLVGKTIRVKTTATPSANNLIPSLGIAIYSNDYSSATGLRKVSLNAGETGTLELTYTVSQNNNPNVGIVLYLTDSSTTSAGDYTDFENLMVTVDDEDMTYEPYGAMPSPDYPSEIENLEGRNIFDKDTANILNAYIDSSHTAITSSDANRLLYIKCKPNITYTIQKLASPNDRMIAYTTEIPAIGVQTYGNFTFTRNTTSKSITTGSDAKYLVFRYYQTSQDSQYTEQEVLDSIQIEEGTVATPYVPYNSLEVKVVNKNLLNKNKTALGSNVTKTVLDTGVRITTKVAGNARYCGIEIGKDELLGKTLTISSIMSASATNQPCVRLFFGDVTTPAKSVIGSTLTTSGSLTVTIPSSFPTGTDRIYLLMYSSLGSSEVGAYVDYTNLQVEINDEATEYEEHQEQTVYFPLAEGQKLYEGSYLADDGIHNVRGQIIFDGSSDENWIKGSYPITGTVQMQIQKPANFFTETGATAVAKLNCSHFKSENQVVNGMAVGGIFNVYPSTDLNITTAAEFKTWLSNNPMTLEYPLAEEEIIPYNTEQQAAWNSIGELHTYKTVTHIYSDAYAEIGYIKDNMLSAFETKASAQLTKNDVSQLKIENGRISSEVSSTQSQLNNYYTKNEADNNTNSTKAELQNIIQQNKTEVEQTTQEIALRVSSIETNGVDKIETSMGYTFNNEGLNIDKEGAATASTIDNEAFKVKNKSANENVFFAGYVSDQDSAYRGQTIVESTNLVVKNYLNIEGASRFQPYVNPVLGGHGTGAFDIG